MRDNDDGAGAGGADDDDDADEAPDNGPGADPLLRYKGGLINPASCIIPIYHHHLAYLCAGRL